MHCRVRSNRSTISRCVYLVRSLSSRGRDCDVETGGNREAANDKKTRHGNTIEEKPTETYKGQRRMSVRARLSRTEHENFLRFQVLSIRLDRKGTLSKDRKSCCQLESERRQPSSLATLLLFEDNGSWLWASSRTTAEYCLRRLKHNSNRLARESCQAPDDSPRR